MCRRDVSEWVLCCHLLGCIELVINLDFERDHDASDDTSNMVTIQWQWWCIGWWWRYDIVVVGGDVDVRGRHVFVAHVARRRASAAEGGGYPTEDLWVRDRQSGQSAADLLWLHATVAAVLHHTGWVTTTHVTLVELVASLFDHQSSCLSVYYFVGLSIYHSVFLSICLCHLFISPTYVSSVCLSGSPFLSPAACSSSICLSFYLYLGCFVVHPSVCQSTCQSIHRTTCMDLLLCFSKSTSAVHVSGNTYLSVCLSVHLPDHPSLHCSIYPTFPPPSLLSLFTPLSISRKLIFSTFQRRPLWAGLSTHCTPVSQSTTSWRSCRRWSLASVTTRCQRSSASSTHACPLTVTRRSCPTHPLACPCVWVTFDLSTIWHHMEMFSSIIQNSSVYRVCWIFTKIQILFKMFNSLFL